MANEVRIKGLENLRRNLGKTGKETRALIVRVLRQHLREAVKSGRRQIPKRAGFLRRAFGQSVRSKKDKVVARFGYIKKIKTPSGEAPPHVYAGLQEEGGTIRPKKAKFLRIPLTADRRRGDFIRRTNAGNLIIFARGDGDQPVPLYLLKKSITVKAHPVIEPTWNRARPLIIRDLEAETQRMIDEVARG